MTKPKTTPSILAAEHWIYTEQLLKLSGVSDSQLPLLKFLYTMAMIHGYKHAKEDMLHENE